MTDLSLLNPGTSLQLDGAASQYQEEAEYQQEEEEKQKELHELLSNAFDDFIEDEDILSESSHDERDLNNSGHGKPQDNDSTPQLLHAQPPLPYLAGYGNPTSTPIGGDVPPFTAPSSGQRHHYSDPSYSPFAHPDSQHHSLEGRVDPWQQQQHQVVHGEQQYGISKDGIHSDETDVRHYEGQNGGSWEQGPHNLGGTWPVQNPPFRASDGCQYDVAGRLIGEREEAEGGNDKHRPVLMSQDPNSPWYHVPRGFYVENYEQGQQYGQGQPTDPMYSPKVTSGGEPVNYNHGYYTSAGIGIPQYDHEQANYYHPDTQNGQQQQQIDARHQFDIEQLTETAGGENHVRQITQVRQGVGPLQPEREQLCETVPKLSQYPDSYRVAYSSEADVNRNGTESREITASSGPFEHKGPDTDAEEDSSMDSRQFTQLKILYKARGRKLEDLTQEVDTLKQESSREIRIMKHQLTMANGDREGMETSLKQCQALLRDSKEEVMDLKNKLQTSEAQVQALRQGKEELTNRLHSAEVNIESLNEQLAELSQSESLDRARVQHQTIVSGLQQKYDTEILTLKEKLDQAKDQLMDKETDIKSLRQQLCDIQRHAENSQISRAETINRLTHSLEDSQKQCQSLLDSSVSQELGKIKAQFCQATAAKTLSEEMCHSLQGELMDLKEQLSMFETASNLGAFSAASVKSKNVHTDSMADLGIKKTLYFKTPDSLSRTDIPEISDDYVTNLKTELERCLLSNKDKRAQVSKLHTELRTARTELSDLASRCERAEKSADELKEKLKEYEVELGEGDTVNPVEKRLRKDIDNLTKEKNILLSELQDLKQRLEEVASNEEQLNEINRELNIQISQMVRDYDEDKRVGLEKSHDAYMKMIEDSKTRVREELEGRYEKSREDLVEKYEAELIIVRDELRGAWKEVDQTKELYIKVCEDKNKLEVSLREEFQQRQQLETEIKEDLTRQKETELENANTLNTGSIQSAVAEAKQKWLTDQQNEMKKKIETEVALAKVDWFKDQGSSRQAAVESAVRAAEQEWKLQHEALIDTQLEQKITEAREQWVAENKSNFATELKKEVEKQKGKWIENHGEANATRSSLQEELMKLQEELMKLQEENEKFQEQSVEQQEEMSKVKKNFEKLKEELEKLETDIVKLKEERQKLQEGLTKVQEENEKLHEEKAELQETVKKELILLQDDAEKLQEEKIKLQDTAHVEITRLQEGTVKLQEESGKLQKENGSLQNENRKLQGENDTLQSGNRKLQEESESLQRENVKLQEEKTKLCEETKAELESAIQTSIKENEERLRNEIKKIVSRGKQQSSLSELEIQSRIDKEVCFAVDNVQKELRAEEEVNRETALYEARETVKLEMSERFEGRIAVLQQEVHTLKGQVDTLHAEGTRNRERWLEEKEKLIEEKNTQRKRAVEEIQAQCEKDVQQFIENHQDTLTKALKHTREQHAAEKAEVEKTHQEEVQQLKVREKQLVGSLRSSPELSTEVHENRNNSNRSFLEKAAHTLQLKHGRVQSEGETTRVKSVNFCDGCSRLEEELKSLKESGNLEQLREDKEKLKEKVSKYNGQVKKLLQERQKLQQSLMNMQQRQKLQQQQQQLQEKAQQDGQSQNSLQKESSSDQAEMQTERQLRAQLQRTEALLKEVESKRQQQLEQLQKSLEAENTVAMEKLKQKLVELSKSHLSEVDSLQRKFSGEKQEMLGTIHNLKSATRVMTSTPVQTESSEAERNAILEVRAHYIDAVTKIREDVLKHVTETNVRSAQKIKEELAMGRSSLVLEVKSACLQVIRNVLEQSTPSHTTSTITKAIEKQLGNIAAQTSKGKTQLSKNRKANGTLSKTSDASQLSNSIGGKTLDTGMPQSHQIQLTNCDRTKSSGKFDIGVIDRSNGVSRIFNSSHVRSDQRSIPSERNDNVGSSESTIPKTLMPADRSVQRSNRISGAQDRHQPAAGLRHTSSDADINLRIGVNVGQANSNASVSALNVSDSMYVPLVAENTINCTIARNSQNQTVQSDIVTSHPQTLVNSVEARSMGIVEFGNTPSPRSRTNSAGLVQSRVESPSPVEFDRFNSPATREINSVPQSMYKTIKHDAVNSDWTCAKPRYRSFEGPLGTTSDSGLGTTSKDSTRYQSRSGIHADGIDHPSRRLPLVGRDVLRHGDNSLRSTHRQSPISEKSIGSPPSATVLTQYENVSQNTSKFGSFDMLSMQSFSPLDFDTEGTMTSLGLVQRSPRKFNPVPEKLNSGNPSSSSRDRVAGTSDTSWRRVLERRADNDGQGHSQPQRIASPTSENSQPRSYQARRHADENFSGSYLHREGSTSSHTRTSEPAANKGRQSTKYDRKDNSYHQYLSQSSATSDSGGHDCRGNVESSLTRTVGQSPVSLGQTELGQPIHRPVPIMARPSQQSASNSSRPRSEPQ